MAVKFKDGHGNVTSRRSMSDQRFRPVWPSEGVGEHTTASSMQVASARADKHMSRLTARVAWMSGVLVGRTPSSHAG
jgi:hypothetical protein